MAGKAKSAIKCMYCEKEKNNREFYVSYHEEHADTGKLPRCKSCLNKKILNTDGKVDIDMLKTVLKEIDRPFLVDYWESSFETNSNRPFGEYMKQLALVQNRQLRWSDSVFEHEETVEEKESEARSYEKWKNYVELKYGFGYEDDEYRAFERKWDKMIDNYGEKTSLHTENLIVYIRHRVKEEMASAKGDVKAARDWGMLASTAAKDGKINVSQMSRADLTGGVELIAQLFEAVESGRGAISILEWLKRQPYDDADLIIWSVISKLRQMEGKPRASYREIWNFYDEMQEEFYAGQGFSKKQIEEEKKKRGGDSYRDLSKVYIEPLYLDDEIEREEEELRKEVEEVE